MAMEEMKDYYGIPSHKSIAIQFHQLSGAWDLVEKGEVFIDFSFHCNTIGCFTR